MRIHLPILPFAALIMSVALVQQHAAGAPFVDVSSSSPYKSAIERLQREGVVSGYADGQFRSTANVNRAEFLKMVMLASASLKKPVMMEDGTEGELPVPAFEKCFTDFTGEYQWYWDYGCQAKDLGIMSGYPDGTFGGTKNVNFAEALKISVRAWKIKEPQYFRAPDNWYEPFVSATRSYTKVFDMLEGKKLEEPLTREQTAFIIDAFMNPGTPLCGGHRIGDNYKKDCNTCSCTDKGEVCTLMACAASSSSATVCHVDDDCKSTERCEQICTQHGESCIGVCTPKTTATTCSSSNDCAADEWCETYACAGNSCYGSCKKGVSSKLCMSNAECGGGQVCTTTDGDCRSVCPKGDTTCVGADVCQGICREETKYLQ